MKYKIRMTSTVLALVLLLASFSLITCSGGGGGSDSLSSGTSASSGTAAIFIADGPADDYEAIWITITEVSFIPAERSADGSPVVIFQSTEGQTINLLEYRDYDYMLTVKDRVPAGFYEKIRLRISDIQTEGGPCDIRNIKLPSGKIDLNPRGGFEVMPGETISVRLDVDANKSINLHEAGKSGKCIFRPVVFVDISTLDTIQRCPQLVRGQIDSLIDDDDDGNIEGFILALQGKRGDLEVHLSGDTIIFDENGSFTDPSALKPGQDVRVRGRLAPDGTLKASLVVIGDVIVLKGAVAGSVESINSQDQFPLDLDPGQAVLDDSIDVAVTGDTLVLLGCDEEVDLDAIQPGMRARVVGKLSEGDLLAVVVLLEPEQITGDLVSISPVAGGNDLTIRYDGSSEVDVFLPAGTSLYLEGNGEADINLLSELVNCNPRKVRVVLDPHKTFELTATEVRVEAEKLIGTVQSVSEPQRQLTLTDGKVVLVQPGATILADNQDDDLPVPFGAIKEGDELTLFGLEACAGDTIDFYAYIVLIKDTLSDS